MAWECSGTGCRAPLKSHFLLPSKPRSHWGTSGFAKLICSPAGVRMEQCDTATNRLRYFAIVNFVLLLSLNSGKASFAVVLGFCNSRHSKWRRAFKPSIAIANLFGIMIEAPKWMPKASIQPVFTTFHSCSGLTSFDFIRANQFLEAPYKRSFHQ